MKTVAIMKGTSNLAVLVGVIALVGAGAAYRLAEGYYGRPSASAPLPPGTLDRLPMELGDWVGRDLPMDERIIKATDTDAHLNRTYTRRTSRAAVWLFVGYGARMRDMLPHRPEVCYPAAGWTMQDQRIVNVRGSDGVTLPVQVQRFRRGGLDSETITVLNFYIVDGQSSPDVELLRSKAAMASPSARYVAQVEIASATQDDAADVAERAVSDFAAHAAPAVRELLMRSVESRNE